MRLLILCECALHSKCEDLDVFVRGSISTETIPPSLPRIPTSSLALTQPSKKTLCKLYMLIQSSKLFKLSPTCGDIQNYQHMLGEIESSFKGPATTGSHSGGFLPM